MSLARRIAVIEDLLLSGNDLSTEEVLEKNMARQDPFYLLENGKLWIKTKDASLTPLVLNDDQRRILETIRHLQSRGKPVRIWILKARHD